MRIIKDKISIQELRDIAKQTFGNMVKAVVDVEKEVLALGGELHSDEEALLLNKGSKQKNLWGINLYLDLGKDEWIEFDSVINIKPSQGNLSRGVDDPKIAQRIIKIVNRLIQR